MRISIGGDHAGPALKKVITEQLVSKGHEVTNRGTDSSESVDYPDHAHQVALDVQNGEVDRGILICGSANGVAMTANKHQAVRAGIAWNAKTAALTRQHNNANILCIPARFVDEAEALDIVTTFLSEDFEGGRHDRRVGKIACASFVGFMALFSVLSAQSTKWAETINASDLENHLTVLASDAFEGRETGEPGAEKAAAYIASYFESVGIAPYHEAGYYQEVSMVRSQILGGSLTVSGTSFEFLEEYVFYPGIRDKSIENLPMVFASWGEPDDFIGLDCTGSVVVVFSGTAGAAEENWRDGLEKKRLNAEANGARALVVIGEGLGAYKGRLKPWLLRKSMRLDQPDPKETEGTRLPTFFMEGSSTKNWWGQTNLKSWKKIQKKKAKGAVLTAQSMPTASWSFNLNDRSGKFNTQNVLGYIPGRDSVLKEELVVITAHYDHVGVIDGEIHNGADDDGSGTVTVLELAQAFMAAVDAGEGPRRSVLLMTVVGEEKGLLGSEWYSDHPVWPLENTVANLNIDMIGRTDEAHPDDDRYVYLIGSDKLSSELHEISENANSEFTQLALDYTFNAPDDPNRFYYRSDHYNFAKHNIPVIFYFSGVHEDYHKPGDDPEKIHYDKTAEIGRLVFHTAWQLANQDKRIEVDMENDFPEK